MINWLIKKLLIHKIKNNELAETAILLAEAFEDSIDNTNIRERRDSFMLAVDVARDKVWW